MIRGSGFTVTATMPAAAKSHIRISAILAPLDGAPAEYVTLNPTSPKADTYHSDVKCPAGCRLSVVSIDDLTAVDPNAADFNPFAPIQTTAVTFTRSVQTGPDAPLVSAADFGPGSTGRPPR